MIEPLYAEFGRHVARARKKAGLSQEQLGRLLKPARTRNTIAGIERGRARITLHLAVQIIDALDAPMTPARPIKPAIEPRTFTYALSVLQEMLHGALNSPTFKGRAGDIDIRKWQNDLDDNPPILAVVQAGRVDAIEDMIDILKSTHRQGKCQHQWRPRTLDCIYCGKRYGDE